jgi:hypothetical protein
MPRLVPALGMLLTLAGCWSGRPWFAASDSVAAIPDGRYRLAEPGGRPEGNEVLRIAHQRDGALRIDGGDAPLRAVIVPLGGAGGVGRYIVQLEKPDPDRPGKAMFLMLDGREGRYQITIPRCGSAAAEAAEGSGGSVARDPQAGSTCVFADRDTLVTTLRAAMAATPEPDLELERVVE